MLGPVLARSPKLALKKNILGSCWTGAPGIYTVSPEDHTVLADRPLNCCLIRRGGRNSANSLDREKTFENDIVVTDV